MTCLLRRFIPEDLAESSRIADRNPYFQVIDVFTFIFMDLKTEIQMETINVMEVIACHHDEYRHWNMCFEMSQELFVMRRQRWCRFTTFMFGVLVLVYVELRPIFFHPSPVCSATTRGCIPHTLALYAWTPWHISLNPAYLVLGG